MIVKLSSTIINYHARGKKANFINYHEKFEHAKKEWYFDDSRTRMIANNSGW